AGRKRDPGPHDRLPVGRRASRASRLRRLFCAQPPGADRTQPAHRRDRRGAGQGRALLQERQGTARALERLRRRLTATNETDDMSLLTEFREFAARGSVIDLAVGVIIGASFGKIITSLVDQVVMPPIGLLLGKVDFAHLEWVLKPADAAAGVEKVAIQY